MAIQIWDAQAGQYKSADLARFGGSGTLTEALVWDGTQYVKVWPVGGGGFTWEDDFTTPALHERWTLFDGTYTPPGLADADVIGPDLGGTFEVTATVVPNGGMALLLALDSDMAPIVIVQIDALNVTLGGAPTAAAAPGGPVTLRRADGHWSVLHGGQPLIGYGGEPLSIPDVHSGPAFLALQLPGATVTHIGYRAL